MAVSLTHVQPALPGLTTGGAQGQLTLNVLNKTEALLAQLQALSTEKNHTVEVLKALQNGRAEVLVGALRLDVKASLPLKAGEVYQLKFEQVGSALRFVQPLRGETATKGQNGSGDPQAAALRSPPVQTPAGQKAGHIPTPEGGAGKTIQRGLSGAPLNGEGVQAGKVASKNSAPLAVEGKALPPGKTPETANPRPPGQPLRQDTTGQSPTQNGGRGAPAPGSGIGGAANGPLKGQVGGAPVSLTVSPHLARQSTTTALLRAVNEVLPELGRAAHALPPQQGGAKGEAPGGGAQGQLLGQGFAAKGGPGGKLDGGLQSLASEVSATYKQTSRTVREESGELKQQTLRPADVHLEMAFGPNRPPFSVWLYFDREPEGTHLYGEERGHALRFTFESEETGEIQAELALTGNLIRVQIAAGRAEMAAAIEEQLETLEARLEAKGLKVGGLFVARSLPAHATRHASDHLDEEI